MSYVDGEDNAGLKNDKMKSWTTRVKRCALRRAKSGAKTRVVSHAMRTVPVAFDRQSKSGSL